MKRIKVMPRKSETLCKKCFYGLFNEGCPGFKECKENCRMRQQKPEDEHECKCLNIALGEPCRHFKHK